MKNIQQTVADLPIGQIRKNIYVNLKYAYFHCAAYENGLKVISMFTLWSMLGTNKIMSQHANMQCAIFTLPSNQDFNLINYFKAKIF